MIVVVSLCHSIILFHAAESFIDGVEWPDIQILQAASELTLFIEEVDRNATNRQLSVLLKDEHDAKSQSSLDWDLAVPELFEFDDLVEVDSLSEVDLLRFSS